jgi:hypothetical protein
MEAFGDASTKKDPVVILRDYDEPESAPCLQAGVKRFDFDKKPAIMKDTKKSFGTKPNVDGIKVIKAIKTALGSAGYQLHVSDGSYTGYTIQELKEYMNKFNSTDLKVWIEEVFDCDDFAQVLQGNVNYFFPGIAFGTIWYGPQKPPWWGHAVNLFYSYTNNKVYLVEPQNDIFYEFNKKAWRAWMVII